MSRAVLASLLFGAASGAQLVTKNATGAPHATEAQKACEDACGPNADVTCYTDCEVALYRCFDIAVGKKECKDGALKQYSAFVAVWNTTALHAQKMNMSSRKVEEKCSGVCGADSICRTACEVDMYECFDANTPVTEDKIESCQEDALKKHKGLVSFVNSHVSLVKVGNDECSAACSDSFCQTQCEVMMYECFDTNTPVSEDKIKDCQKAAVEHVKKEYAASFLNAHNLFLRRKSGDWEAHVVSAEIRHHGQEECGKVCGIDAQCQSSCEVEMYTCHDVHTPKGQDKLKACEEAALEKHKNYRVAALLAIKPKSFLASSI